MDQYLVAVQRSDVEEGSPSVVFHLYEHNVANSEAEAWNEVKKRFAEPGATIVMGRVTRKAVPTTHVDVEIRPPQSIR